jgi:hypothetical protein
LSEAVRPNRKPRPSANALASMSRS